MSANRLVLVALLATASGFTPLAGLAQPATQQNATTRKPASAPDLTEQLNGLGAQWVKDLGLGYYAAVKSPFVVVAWPTEAVAASYLNGTVLEAVNRLQRQYSMTGAIDKPLVILVFKSKKGYRKCCDAFLDNSNPPPRVLYRADKGTMVVDSGGGDGPLIAALTRVAVSFDFPQAPEWLTGGLASLYGPSTVKDDKVVGLVNSQLAELQEALATNKIGTLEELTKCDFRGPNAHLTRLQARYFFQYLQDRKMLEKFYQVFRDRPAEDPTGLKFLAEAFAPKPLDQVDKDWRQWVGTLKQE